MNNRLNFAVAAAFLAGMLSTGLLASLQATSNRPEPLPDALRLAPAMPEVRPAADPDAPRERAQRDV